MGKIKGFLFAVRHREILMTDLGLIISLAKLVNYSLIFVLIAVILSFFIHCLKKSKNLKKL